MVSTDDGVLGLLSAGLQDFLARYGYVAAICKLQGEGAASVLPGYVQSWSGADVSEGRYLSSCKDARSALVPCSSAEGVRVLETCDVAQAAVWEHALLDNCMHIAALNFLVDWSTLCQTWLRLRCIDLLHTCFRESTNPMLFSSCRRRLLLIIRADRDLPVGRGRARKERAGLPVLFSAPWEWPLAQM